MVTHAQSKGSHRTGIPTTPKVKSELRSMPFFADLSEAELQDVSSMIRELRYVKGQIVFLEGEKSQGIYVLKSGRVTTFKASPDGREQALRIVEKGELFNQVSAIDDCPNLNSAQALSPSVVYLLSTEAARLLLLRYPGFAYAVLRVLSGRIRALCALVEDLSLRHVDGRVARVLLMHVSQVGEPAAQRGKKWLTQQRMATLAGTSRPVVWRSLKALEGQGLIRLERGQIIIPNPSALENLPY